MPRGHCDTPLGLSWPSMETAEGINGDFKEAFICVTPRVRGNKGGMPLDWIHVLLLFGEAA